MAEQRHPLTIDQELELLALEDDDHYSAERRTVLLWRLGQLTELGFDLATAATLAGAPVDLGTARKLVAAGCPTETASRILL
jgi:hypothetical protein